MLHTTDPATLAFHQSASTTPFPTNHPMATWPPNGPASAMTNPAAAAMAAAQQQYTARQLSAALAAAACMASSAASCSPTSNASPPSSCTGGCPTTTLSNTTTSQHHQQQQQQAVNLLPGLLAKDSRWLTLEVCRRFQRNECKRDDNECKFAHPPEHVDVQNGRVVCCYDSLRGKCHRSDPPCKYLHPPSHLREQLAHNGRQALVMRNFYLQLLVQHQGQQQQQQQGQQLNGGGGQTSPPIVVQQQPQHRHLLAGPHNANNNAGTMQLQSLNGLALASTPASMAPSNGVVTTASLMYPGAAPLAIGNPFYNIHLATYLNALAAFGATAANGTGQAMAGPGAPAFQNGTGPGFDLYQHAPPHHAQHLMNGNYRGAPANFNQPEYLTKRPVREAKASRILINPASSRSPDNAPIASSNEVSSSIQTTASDKPNQTTSNGGYYDEEASSSASSASSATALSSSNHQSPIIPPPSLDMNCLMMVNNEDQQVATAVAAALLGQSMPPPALTQVPPHSLFQQFAAQQGSLQSSAAASAYHLGTALPPPPTSDPAYYQPAYHIELAPYHY